MSEVSLMPLPTEVDAITADWLTQALRTKHAGVTVRSAEIVDVIRGTCTKIRIGLELDDEGHRAGIPASIMLKGGFEPHSRNVTMNHMHEREVRGYREVLPELGLPSPACYFARYDPEVGQGIVIMEDLAAKGVTFCSALEPQSFDQVARRLTVLARFHAQTWNSSEIAPGGKWSDLVDFYDVMDGFFYEKANPENWARFCGLPRGAAVSKRLQDRDWMTAGWERLKHYSRDLPRCVLHGDIHLGNLYIEKDGTPGFLDTLASLGPGMLEVSYHITASIDVADRRNWEGALVQRYLDELRANGVEAPSFEDAMHQYVMAMVYGHFIWMTTESRYQPEAVNAANCARMSAAMLDHDAIGVVNAVALPE